MVASAVVGAFSWSITKSNDTIPVFAGLARVCTCKVWLLLPAGNVIVIGFAVVLLPAITAGL